jgi:hypothetical protein
VIAWIFSHEKHDNLLIINCWMSAENSQMLSRFRNIFVVLAHWENDPHWSFFKFVWHQVENIFVSFCWLYEIGSINKGEYITCRHLHFFFMLQQAVHGLWYGLWTSAGLVRILLIFGRQLAVFKHILGLGHHVYNAS